METTFTSVGVFALLGLGFDLRLFKPILHLTNLIADLAIPQSQLLVDVAPIRGVGNRETSALRIKTLTLPFSEVAISDETMSYAIGYCSLRFAAIEYYFFWPHIGHSGKSAHSKSRL
ncbi:MAG: hypothetical protein ABR501_10590 [Pyrinomonadaceae bacterium]